MKNIINYLGTFGMVFIPLAAAFSAVCIYWLIQYIANLY